MCTLYILTSKNEVKGVQIISFKYVFIKLQPIRLAVEKSDSFIKQFLNTEKCIIESLKSVFSIMQLLNIIFPLTPEKLEFLIIHLLNSTLVSE